VSSSLSSLDYGAVAEAKFYLVETGPASGGRVSSSTG
jgi:hypothetical protein